MPSIARQQIAGISVAAVPIASANLPDRQQPYVFHLGSSTFTPPVAGYWKFIGWGPGHVPSSGAYVEITRYLTTVQSVAVVVGQWAASDTTITFPDGTVATAGRASGAAGGTASGGDVNLNGTTGATGTGATGGAGLGTGGGAGGAGDGGTNDGGCGAPANLPYRGAPGSVGSAVAVAFPGPGAGTGQGAIGLAAGPGLVLAVLIRE